MLRAAPAPLGVAEAARRMGLHPNTVRFHLDALVADGLAERRAVAPTGPGRPRTVYTVRPGMDRGGHRDYRLLARMVLSRWAAADPAEARAEAMETGRAWGRFLVDPLPPYEPATPERSVAALLTLLDGLGFAPQPEGRASLPQGRASRPEGGASRPQGEGRADGETGRTPERIRLRHCPFLELAEERSALVCPIHLGLMQGALAELGAPLTATALEPFAEPDSCVAHLAGTTPG